MVKIIALSVTGAVLLGLLLRFVATARQGRIFVRSGDTMVWTLFRTDYLPALLNFVLQFRLLKAGWLRWLIHLSMHGAFVYLVLVHALDDWTSEWFTFYQPGIDPFRFLRNLAGFLALTGAVAFFIRRIQGLRINRERRRRGIRFRVRGTLTIFLVMGILVAGFLAEGFQIASEDRFDEMVEEYSDLSGQPDLDHLRAYWQTYYHVSFDRDWTAGQGDLAQGDDLNQDFCLNCHTRPDSAFVSVRLADLLGGLGHDFRPDRIFYWLHFALVMILLVCLPFSRMFHLIAIPLATARRRITPEQMRHDMGMLDLVSLSACTQCGFCTEVCSVYPDYQMSENPQVLPHLKLGTLRSLAASGVPDPLTLTRLRSGNGDCTRCGLCADICPSGIDLVRLWAAADQVLDRMGCPDNYTAVMETPFAQWTGKSRGREPETAPPGGAGGFLPDLMQRAQAFEHCVQCTLCTNACPVVAHDLDKNDLGPHQVMNLLRLGQQRMASGSRMVWHCLTCYMCQEVCPQSIRVADIMLELRSLGQEQAARLTLTQLKGEQK